jgi:hypothetical protein
LVGIGKNSYNGVDIVQCRLTLQGNIMGKMDKEMFKTGRSGEKVPMGALSSDTSGERKGKIVGGVAMGKEDKTMGMEGEFNTGKTAGVCYTHDRSHYR